MNAISPSESSRSPRRQTRFVIVRANAPLFYSIVIGSFLENDAAEGGRGLMQRLNAQHETAQWMEAEWLPGKQSRAQALRQYVEQCWPEFGWDAAYEQYRDLMARHGKAVAYRRDAAREALEQCVNACQAGLFYRALARWSDDHALRALARDAACHEACAFERFRSVLDSASRCKPIGFVRAWRLTRACARYARDTRVRHAFDALNANCGFNAPFPILDYPEFLGRMRAVIDRCAAPAWAERVLFSAWRRAPSLNVGEPRQPRASWFRPVLSQAA
jgi:hypothetical protein